MVIRFQPGKLGTKPDALTRRWDVYPKGGNNDVSSANPSNLRPIFTDKQISTSFCATYFATPIIHSAILIDIKKLHDEIRHSLHLDCLLAAQLPTPTDANWTMNSNGLLLLNDRIYVPDAADL